MWWPSCHHVRKWVVVPSGVAWVSGTRGKKWTPCPDFFPENFPNGRPKTNFGHLQKWQAKKKKISPLIVFIMFIHGKSYNIHTFLQERITNCELLSDLWTICTKCLVYYFLYQDDFSPNVAPGVRAPSFPLATPLIVPLDFFAAMPAKRELPFPHQLKSCGHNGYHPVNHTVTIMSTDHAKSKDTIIHLHILGSIWLLPQSVNKRA